MFPKFIFNKEIGQTIKAEAMQQIINKYIWRCGLEHAFKTTFWERIEYWYLRIFWEPWQKFRNEINSLKDLSDYYPKNLEEAIDKANDLYRMWMKQGNKEDAITIGFLLSHAKECPSCRKVEEVVRKLKERFEETENLEMKAELELIIEMLTEEAAHG